jgi:hypothetical protein
MRLPRRLSARAFRTDYLIRASMLAIERWDRLTPDEQDRFRELAPRAGMDLTSPEKKELKRMWKRLEVTALLREAIRMLRTGKREGAPRAATAEPDDVEPAPLTDPSVSAR